MSNDLKLLKYMLKQLLDNPPLSNKTLSYPDILRLHADTIETLEIRIRGLGGNPNDPLF